MKTAFTRILLAAGLVALCTGIQAGHHKVSNGYAKDIVSTARDAGNFTTLLAAIEAAGLTETLEGEGPFTVFAPTDEAFSQVPEEVLNGLLADPDALAAVLTYHVVPGRVLAADVVGLSSATTVQGSEVSISANSDGVKVDEARVVATDIEAKNGVIHVIDAVITP